MSKHDAAKRAKEARNAEYAQKYRQLQCKKCGHRSSRKEPPHKPKCKLCDGDMKSKRKRRSRR